MRGRASSIKRPRYFACSSALWSMRSKKRTMPDFWMADQASWDVPSVATHRQNSHPCWLLSYCAGSCRHLATYRGPGSREGTYARHSLDRFPRLFLRSDYIFMHFSRRKFSRPRRQQRLLLVLSHDVFWLSYAQVEIMRILATRWYEFSNEDRDALEARLARGIPRDLFPADAFEDEESGSRYGTLRCSSD